MTVDKAHGWGRGWEESQVEYEGPEAWAPGWHISAEGRVGRRDTSYPFS